MADYLAPFKDLFEDDKRLRFHVVLLGEAAFTTSDEERRILVERLGGREVRRLWAFVRSWDLIVCSDHCLGDARTRSPSVYVGHGPKCKVLTDEEVEYSYGAHAHDSRGRLAYDCIFEEREAERDWAVQENPALHDISVFVGSLENDKLLAQVSRRAEYRQELGFGPNDIVVFVLSTWGEHCFFRAVGDAFLAEAGSLMDEFKFILSIHPHEYRGEQSLGRYIDSQRDQGFVVRDPSDDWVPYMIACDALVSDYTGLIAFAALLEKPIILSPVPKNRIWEGSVIWEARRFAPMLDDAARLREVLNRTKTEYPVEELRQLAQSASHYPGEAARRTRKETFRLLNMFEDAG